MHSEAHEAYERIQIHTISNRGFGYIYIYKSY